jgi:hypothetical protein
MAFQGGSVIERVIEVMDTTYGASEKQLLRRHNTDSPLPATKEHWTIV